MKRAYKTFFVVAFIALIMQLFITASASDISEFAIHFIDVGQADAAVIICDDEVLMIDGGNASDSSLIYSYLTKTLELEHIDYMIATHAHEDHIGGLSGALNACTVGKVYSPVTEYDSEAFESLVKYVHKQGLELSVPSVGEIFNVGSAKVQFLSPAYLYENTNDTSIVVRIVYGNTAFLFTGDAEWDAEHDMVDSGHDLSANLLKVGHHGSNSSSCYVFLREIMPEYAVISVGEDNSYGHPTEDVLSRLRDADAIVYRTDLYGDIICYSDGDNLTFETEFVVENEDIDLGETVWDWNASSQESGSDENISTIWDWGMFTIDEPEELESEYTGNAPFVGNKGNKKVHYADCSSVIDIKDKNKVDFYDRDVAIAAGYEPCGACNP